MKIVLTRESVAAGDDVWAPHRQEIEVDGRRPLELTIRDVLDAGYLPSIFGGQATWVVTSDPIEVGFAVVAQQWALPRMLVDGSQAIGHVSDRLHFLYCAQRDPDLIADLVASAPREPRNDPDDPYAAPFGLDQLPLHP